MDEPAPRPKRRAIKILLALLFLLMVAAAAGAYWYLFMRGVVSSDDARLDGDLVDLAPEIGGRLDRVLVREGDRVSRDQVLFTLDKKSLEAVLEKAKAALTAAQAGFEVARSKYKCALEGPRSEEIHIARAMEKRLRAQSHLAKLNLDRVRALRNKKVTSQNELDKAKASYESALQAHQEALHRLRLLEEGTRAEDIDAAKANVQLAQGRVREAVAAVSQAKVALDRAVVRAPFDGIVVRQWKKPGEMALPGAPVLTLFNPSTLHVSANIEEKDLKRIAPNDVVEISVDAYPDLRLKGRVEKILRATNSQFSLIPAEGVSGTFIKVAQRVPIRIALEEPPDLPLGPGLSVEISIRTNSSKPHRSGEPGS